MYSAWKGEAAAIGPLVTLAGLVLAWVLPLYRERKQRQRQDKITIRGLQLYLEVLESKVNKLRPLWDEVDRAKAESAPYSAEERGAKIRSAMQEAIPETLQFDGKNLHNHESLERLFVSSEISDLAVRDAVLKFIRYEKLSDSITDGNGLREYRRYLIPALSALRGWIAHKGSRLLKY